MGLDVLRPPAGKYLNVMFREIDDAHDFFTSSLSEETLRIRDIFDADLAVTMAYLSRKTKYEDLDLDVVRGIIENHLGDKISEEEVEYYFEDLRGNLVHSYAPLPHFLHLVINHAPMMALAHRAAWINTVRAIGEQLFLNPSPQTQSTIEMYLRDMGNATDDAEQRFKQDIDELEEAMTKRLEERQPDASFSDMARRLNALAANDSGDDDDTATSTSTAMVPVPRKNPLEALPKDVQDTLKKFGINITNIAQKAEKPARLRIGREEELAQLAIIMGQPDRHNVSVITNDLTEGHRLFMAAAKYFADPTNTSIPGGAVVLEVDWQGIVLDHSPAQYTALLQTLFAAVNRANKDNETKIILTFDNVGKIFDSHVPVYNSTIEFFNQAVRRFPEVRLMLSVQDRHAKAFTDSTPEFALQGGQIRLQQLDDSSVIELLKRKAAKIKDINVAHDSLVRLKNKVKQHFSAAAEPDMSSRILEYSTTAARMAGAKTLTDDIVETTIAKFMNVSKEFLGRSQANRVMRVLAALRNEIFGQEEAIDKIEEALMPVAANLTEPAKPLAIMFFNGPTGVGKTETGRIVAREYSGDANALITINGPDFYEKHTKSQIVGSPPGYVGFNVAKLVFERLINNPNGVVLIDEFDKMHPEVRNVFMEIWDKGFLNLADGRVIDFTKTIWIITGNFGAHQASLDASKNSIGFRDASKADNDAIIQDGGEEALKRELPPEVRGRIETFAHFKTLKKESAYKVTVKYLNIKIAQIAEQMPNVEISFSQNVIDELTKEGFSDLEGARPLKRAVQNKITSALVKQLYQAGEAGLLDYETDKLAVHINSIHEPFVINRKEVVPMNIRQTPVFQ